MGYAGKEKLQQVCVAVLSGSNSLKFTQYNSAQLRMIEGYSRLVPKEQHSNLKR